MQKNKEAMRLPDPLLVRLFRSGDIDSITKVEEDKERNITVHLSTQTEPLKFIHLVDVGWVAEDSCGGR